MNNGIPDAPGQGGDVKRVLVVRFSQTGQLDAVARQIVAPLSTPRAGPARPAPRGGSSKVAEPHLLERADARIVVHEETLRPLRPFPFPWPFFRFLDAFPESAHGVAPALAQLALRGDEDFDLVILPYQVWFLAPSQPITAFLQHPLARRVLQGKPVVTVVACRNMWLMAHEKMRALLQEAGARHIDNVVLTDPGPTLATFITTPRWLLRGKQSGFWGLPPAGLSAAQIAGARRFGLALREALLAGRERAGAPLLAGMGAVQADPRMYISERAGTRSFHLWGRLLMAAGPPGSGQRVPLLVLYVVFLVALIVSVVPASLALQALLRPLMRPWLARIKDRYEQPSGSSRERCHLYED